MIQNVLNFTIEGTNEKLPPERERQFLESFLKRSRLINSPINIYKVPQSNQDYDPYAFIQPLLLMLHSGGKYLEDIRMINADKALCKLLGIRRIPTLDSIGKWLKRSTQYKIAGMERLNRILLKRYLSRIEEPLVLDIDTTVIERHKSIASTTYKCFPGSLLS